MYFKFFRPCWFKLNVSKRSSRLAIRCIEFMGCHGSEVCPGTFCSHPTTFSMAKICLTTLDFWLIEW